MQRPGSALPDPRPDAPESTSRHYIIGLGIGQICSWGTIYYSFPLIAEAMGRDLGWSKTQLYSAATIGLAIAALASFPVGRAIDRGNGRRVMVAASLLAAVLMVAWSRADTYLVFMVSASLLGGLQAATLYEPAFAVVAWREGAARARAGITRLTLWGGFASTVFVPLTQALIGEFGWRGALLGLAAVNAVICAGAYALAIGPASKGTRDTMTSVAHAPTPATARAQAPAPADASVALAVRMPVFWMLMIAIVAYSITFSALTFHLYALLTERGLSASDVVLAIALFGPAQVAGRILVGAFASHYSVKALGSIVVALFPIALIGLMLLPPTLFASGGLMVLFGAANGIFTIVRGLVVPEMVTTTGYGAINGLITGPAMVARAVAPLGAAWVWSLDQSYHSVTTAMLAGSLVCVATFWSAARLARPRSSPARGAPAAGE